ncbi:hypothetical protein [Chromobacterium haemolyticum]|uniref:hypothetical protein n=1 Tax=Chromobacterium haemolyticum TaxID=394935 RepID=UPI001317B961|nr:hypothetical protein [Chromobacterium haemolyticum]BBH11701.1 hypothetical protein CH06BL_09490 [Chromobacterium haemolyticum]
MSDVLFASGLFCMALFVFAAFKPELLKDKNGVVLSRKITLPSLFIAFVVLSSIAANLEVSKSPPAQENTQKVDVVAKVEASTTQAATIETKEVLKIKPEQIVTFPNSSMACLDKDDLFDVMSNFMKGEVTKGNSKFISNDNPNARCIMLDTKMKFKVLSVEYKTEEVGLLEIVGAKSKSSTGAWTLSMTAEPVN